MKMGMAETEMRLNEVENEETAAKLIYLWE